MNNRLTKIGVIGGLITALCCFTPLLPWLFVGLGLTALVGYLDYVLLPLLGLFVVVALIGITRRR